MLRSIGKVGSLLDRRQKVFVAALFVLMIFGSVLEVAGVSIIPAFVVLLGEPERVMTTKAMTVLGEWLDLSSVTEVLLWATVGLIAVFIVKNAYLTWLSSVRANFITNAQHRIGVRLLSAYLNADYTYHLKTNSAHLIRNIKDNVSIIVSGYLLSLVRLVMEGITSLFIFVLLLIVEPIVSIVSLMVLGGTSIGFLAAVKRKTLTLGGLEQHALERMTRAISQGVGGFVEATVLGRKGFFLREFKRGSEEYARAFKFNLVMQEVPQRIIETIVVVGMLTISLAFVARGWDTTNVVPLLALFGTAAIRLMPSLKQIVASFHALQYYSSAFENVHSDLLLLEEKGTRNIQPLTSKSRTLQESLKLADVSYTYPGSVLPAIRNVTMEVTKGSTIALVGRSGSGKTTLANLIVGLLRPSQGEIRVDGRNIHEDLTRWQSVIGLVPQSIYLLDDSIRNNIALGIPDPEIDEDKIRDAVRTSQLEAFVNFLPEKLESIVGEHGVRMSGGQRQRIGIARALYRNPEILILDEATAALDNETEREFDRALETLGSSHTIIIIAHRLSSVEKCDKLYYMEDGRITAEGSYKKLLSESSNFVNMVMGVDEPEHHGHGD